MKAILYQGLLGEYELSAFNYTKLQDLVSEQMIKFNYQDDLKIHVWVKFDYNKLINRMLTIDDLAPSTWKEKVEIYL